MESRPPARRALKGDDAVTPKRCYNCDYWRPNVHYPFIGFCTFHSKFTMDEDSCENWTPLKIDDNDFYWCSTCKTRIMGVEARVLLAKGYKVHRGAYIDPDIKEELYSVF